MYSGVNLFFADVVKCIITDNIEIKKLVYHYLTFYAEQVTSYIICDF